MLSQVQDRLEDIRRELQECNEQLVREVKQLTEDFARLSSSAPRLDEKHQQQICVKHQRWQNTLASLEEQLDAFLEHNTIQPY
ncbi:hypothetical protein LTS17_012250 [Exophiala oligosperma]